MNLESPRLDEFVVRYHAALDEFVRGNPKPARDLYSRGPDISLANPFGPPVTGWDAIVAATDRAAGNYQDGRVTGFDRIAALASGELAYLVEIEHFQARLGGAAEPTVGALRTTSVLRLEGGEWRLLHRHADLMPR